MNTKLFISALHRKRTQTLKFKMNFWSSCCGDNQGKETLLLLVFAHYHVAMFLVSCRWSQNILGLSNFSSYWLFAFSQS